MTAKLDFDLSTLISLGKLYVAALIVHGALLIYFYYFKWQLRSIRELKWYIPRISNYFSTLMSILSVILSIMSINAADENSFTAYLFLAASCSLGINSLALVCSSERKPNFILALLTALTGVAACMPPVQYFTSPIQNGDMTIRFSVGLFNSFLGLTMIQMILRNEDPEDQMWRQMNGNPPQML